MQDLIFYDFDFNRLLDVSKFISVNFTLNYCGFGSFEAHFPKTENAIASMLDNNTYLLCVQGENQAIITGWRIEEDIALFGKTPEWLMTKRGLDIFSHTSAYPTVIANQIVSHSMGDFVTVSAPQALGTLCEYSTSEVHTVHDAVCQVLNKDSLGFTLRGSITDKSFVFRTYQGVNLSVMVSPSNRSAHSMVYTKELQDLAMGYWYRKKLEDMGEWNASTNYPPLTDNQSQNVCRYYKITTDGNRFNLECIAGQYLYSDTPEGKWKTAETVPPYMWLYSDSTEQSGAKKWDCILKGTKTQEEIQAELQTKKINETIDAELRRLEYGTDYSLGDTVRVQFESGEFKKTLTKRVSGIHIFYDVDNQGIRPILSD